MIATAFLLLAAACAEKPDPSDYFPLQKGLHWEYRYHLKTADRNMAGQFSIKNLGTTLIDDQTATIRRTSHGTDYYIHKGDTWLKRIAKRTIVETQPRLDQPARIIFPTQPNRSDDTTWSSSSTAYTLRRFAADTVIEENENDVSFTMEYQLAERDVTLTLPSGTFKNCLLILGRAKVSLYADPSIGFVDVDITTREWYAPGIGLIKLERDEPISTSVIQGGTYTFELTRFSQQ